jgi:hypothetical protein
MIAKKFTTVEQIDDRFVWLDAQIGICDKKADDATEPNRQKFKTRAVNLRHEKAVLTRRRGFLLTPELL